MTKAKLEKLYVMMRLLDLEDKQGWTADEYKMLNIVTSRVFKDVFTKYHSTEEPREVMNYLMNTYLPKEKKSNERK